MPSLVKNGAGIAIGPDNKIVIPSSVDVYDELGQLVGWIESLNFTADRPVDPKRHLSAADAGRIIEVIPQLENFTISISGYHLYNKEDLTGEVPHYSLPARLSMGTGTNGGFNGKYLFQTLASQKVPFNLRIVERHPQTKAESSFWYKGCYLNNWTLGYNIGESTVATSCSGIVSRVASDFEDSDESEDGIIVGNY